MRRFLALLLIAATATVAQTVVAQTVVSVRIGQDANRVPGLVEWQGEDRDALTARGIAVAETDSFPSFASVQAEVGLALAPTRRVIAHAGYGSTSGRLDYSDYSGRARADRRARRVFGGVTGEQALIGAGPVSLWALAGALISHVSVDYDREIILTDGMVVESVSETYTGWPLSVEPALAVEVAAGSVLLRAVGGWEQSLGGGLTGPNAAEASAQWDGYRVGVSVGARF